MLKKPIMRGLTIFLMESGFAGFGSGAGVEAEVSGAGAGGGIIAGCAAGLDASAFFTQLIKPAATIIIKARKSMKFFCKYFCLLLKQGVDKSINRSTEK